MNAPDTFVQLLARTRESFPASTKSYITGSRSDLRVPVRDIALTNGEVVSVYDTSGPYTDPAAIIAACAQLVKPDGMVFFSTINRNPKSYAHAIVGAEYLLGLVPRGTHDWQKFITPAELARMCRQAGLDVVDSKGMTYNPLSKIYRLDDNTDVNYQIACRPQ